MKVVKINIQKLNNEAIEEFCYVIKNKAKFPTYSCPFVSDLCFIKKMSNNGRYKMRNICLRCKRDYLKNIKN